MKGCEDEARQARAEKQQYQPDSLSGGALRRRQLTLNQRVQGSSPLRPPFL
jgi:hypothetical protein